MRPGTTREKIPFRSRSGACHVARGARHPRPATGLPDTPGLLVSGGPADAGRRKMWENERRAGPAASRARISNYPWSRESAGRRGVGRPPGERENGAGGEFMASPARWRVRSRRRTIGRDETLTFVNTCGLVTSACLGFFRGGPGARGRGPGAES